MKALKALVIGMGILIVVGLVVIAVTIVRRNSGDAPVASDKPSLGLAQGGATSPAPAAPPAVRGPLPSFGVRDIAVPEGSEVISLVAGDGRIVLELQDAEQQTRILLLDPATGAALGGWRLVESKSRGMSPSVDQ